MFSPNKTGARLRPPPGFDLIYAKGNFIIMDSTLWLDWRVRGHTAGVQALPLH